MRYSNTNERNGPSLRPGKFFIRDHAGLKNVGYCLVLFTLYVCVCVFAEKIPQLFRDLITAERGRAPYIVRFAFRRSRAGYAARSRKRSLQLFFMPRDISQFNPARRAGIASAREGRETEMLGSCDISRRKRTGHTGFPREQDSARRLT